MKHFNLFLLLLMLMFFEVKAQSSSSENDLNSQDVASSFQPSLAVVIGILGIMFSFTFILVIYVKFCHRASSFPNQQIQGGLVRSLSRFSGIDKIVVESLPFFRFSSLKGSREGLECAVCLAKFEDVEILRLLPKCRHAFHIDCVDQWLDKHSSCPLCRHKISPDDLSLVQYSDSLRFLWNQSDLREDSNLELFVQREDEHQGSSRFSIGSSFRKFLKGKKEEELPIQESSETEEDQNDLHKHNHKIIVSDVVFKNRWSNVNSSDLVILNSEMLNSMSSNRFSSLDSNNEEFGTPKKVIEDGHVMNIKEEMERKRMFESKFCKIKQGDSFAFPGFPTPSESTSNSSQTSKVLDPTGKRSMSEITIHPRLAEFNMKNSARESFPENNEEERKRELWLPIAQRTVQWFANREKVRRPEIKREFRKTVRRQSSAQDSRYYGSQEVI
ncbi:unnamed protein product [Ilex paraguariensis]|uniref:RING-type E3 ubiquitin transferase n=1 Tax=Ilex paraguariensis TaxID=185542 RepID=A0ABC8TZ26_9AQUA